MRPALVALACCIGPAVAQTHVDPRNDAIAATATAGHELVVRTYASWNRSNCAPNPPPQIVLNGQPLHGMARVRPGTSTITRIREGGSASCVGITMPGTTVAYTPDGRFAGQDVFDYTVTSVNGVYHDTVTVDVRLP